MKQLKIVDQLTNFVLHIRNRVYLSWILHWSFFWFFVYTFISLFIMQCIDYGW